MKAAEIRITTDGHIYHKHAFIGFLDDDKVFIVTASGSREIGKFDHRSEVTAMVMDWFNECPQR